MCNHSLTHSLTFVVEGFICGCGLQFNLMLLLFLYLLVPPLVEEWSPPFLDSDGRREGIIALKRPLLAIDWNQSLEEIPRDHVRNTLFNSKHYHHKRTDKTVIIGTIRSQQ